MSDTASTTESLEGRRSHELQRDEDVLSLELQRELESMGTAIGVIAVVALVASQLPRARRLLDTAAAAKEARRG